MYWLCEGSEQGLAQGGGGGGGGQRVADLLLGSYGAPWAKGLL